MAPPRPRVMLTYDDDRSFRDTLLAESPELQASPLLRSSRLGRLKRKRHSPVVSS